MAVTQIFEGFSISHAAILSGSAPVAPDLFSEEADGDIYGVREGSLQADTDSYDNLGDDSVLSSWFWFNFATVSITAGYISFPLVALLSGSTISSSGAGDAIQYDLPRWEETSLNQPARPMLVRVPSKDSNSNTRVMDIVLYKVQFEPLNFDGPTYKDGLVINYSGKALMSQTDEAGTTLAVRAIGRLVNTQAA